MRVEKQGETVRLFCKVCDGAGGYEPGKIIVNKTLDLSQKQADSINHYLDGSTFWTSITELHEGGADGSEWIVEAIKNNRYHMVVRWTPDEGKFRKIGEYLLALADIKDETSKRNYY